MAAVLVVKIYEPSMNLAGDFVLKLYDRRYSDSLRQAYGVEQWILQCDMKFEQRRWSPLVTDFLSRYHGR